MARILIVEDDNFLRDSLIDYLKREGHNVQAAPNGRVARDVLGSNVFDCVLSDIQMPFLDGVELFKWAKDRGNPPPFILMTGFSHLLDMETAIQMGVSEFLVKPFQNHDLKKAVSKVTGI